MPDHTHLKWFSKFITSMDPQPHTKKKLYSSNNSQDQADLLFSITWNDHTPLKWLRKFDFLLMSNHIQKFDLIPQFVCEIL